MRFTSIPLKSRNATGRNGTANFSPKSGAEVLNSADRSSRIMPVNFDAFGVGVKIKKSALACIWSSSVISLRSQR